MGTATSWPAVELHVPALDEGQLHSLHDLAARIEAEAMPEDRPIPFAEFGADLRREVSFTRNRRWAVWGSGGEAIGYATLELDDRVGQNDHLGWGWIAVAPDRRRRGIGAALLRALAEAVRDEGRRVLGVDARVDLPGARFLPAFGLEERYVEHRNRLRIAEVDPGLLTGWVDRATERASGYELRLWDDRTPEELVDGVAAVHEAMNDAPLDDLDYNDEHLTPEQLREKEASRLECGIHWWTAATVERATGRVAGFSQLYFSEWRDDVAFQGDTGVDPAHRNRGLGRWLKAANLLRLLEERPSVEKVDTWNAGSNDPMLAINHALGFTPVEIYGGFQGDVATIIDRLDAR